MRFGEYPIGQRIGIVALSVILLASLVVVLIVLAGLSVRLVEWVWS